ncbi:MAG: extracellular solute-binding protein [Alphaproteobacteria bacterium]|nr:extracellular solute-binding protein [Alphaproteobacteria bacterium]
MSRLRKLQKTKIFLFVLSVFAVPAMDAVAANEVNIYSYRQEFLIRPFLDQFTKDTGIAVNVVYAKKGILQRLKQEGANTPADVVLTAGFSRLKALKDAGLLQPVDSAALKANVPAKYRDPAGEWVGLTLRSRIIAYSKARVADGAIQRYEDLVDPKWKGKICVRTGSHYYNRALVASMVAAHGEAKTEAWVKGLVANFARKPQGNDRAQAKAVFEGVCDIAVMNTYYFGKMKFNKKNPEQRDWAASLQILFPNQGDRGAHVNVSGAGVVKHAKNRDNAVRLLEFLSDGFAQKMYAAQNYEYPVKPGVGWSDEVKSWGDYKADGLALVELFRLGPAAQRIIDRAGWQ